MGYCYPGRVKGGDLPPRSECAELWLDLLLSKLPKVELPLIVGGHAQRHFLGRRREGGNLSSRKDSGQMWMRDTTP
jgi:uracil-DNA glycosylase